MEHKLLALEKTVYSMYKKAQSSFQKDQGSKYTSHTVLWALFLYAYISRKQKFQDIEYNISNEIIQNYFN